MLLRPQKRTTHLTFRALTPNSRDCWDVGLVTPSMLLAASLLIAAWTPHAKPELRILFLGNSHTASNNLTGMVKSLLEADGSGRRVAVKSGFAPFLNDFWKNEKMKASIKNDKWDIVVLQAAFVSSSHTRKYSQEGGINIANLAREAGARTMLFVEWPRRGWNESNQQMAVYKDIAKATKAELIPICYAFDNALKVNKNLQLWASDGNHSNRDGAYLASCTIYHWITGGKSDSTWMPEKFDPKMGAFLRSTAKTTVLRWKRILRGEAPD